MRRDETSDTHSPRERSCALLLTCLRPTSGSISSRAPVLFKPPSRWLCAVMRSCDSENVNVTSPDETSEADAARETQRGAVGHGCALLLTRVFVRAVAILAGRLRCSSRRLAGSLLLMCLRGTGRPLDLDCMSRIDELLALLPFFWARRPGEGC